MVLFSRNPRFRALSKVYGFFIVVGAGTVHWMRIHKKYLVDLLGSSIQAVSTGKDPLDSFFSETSFTPFEIKDPVFTSKLLTLKNRETEINSLINQEEFLRMQMLKSLKNQTKSL